MTSNPWIAIANQVHRGEYPSDAALASAIRRAEIPENVRGYVADRLERKVRRIRGRQKATLEQRRVDSARMVMVATEVNMWQAEYELARKRRPGPYERALQTVAALMKGDAETLGRKIREFKEYQPEDYFHVPSVELCKTIVVSRQARKGGV